MIAEVRPGTGGFVTFVETLYGLARDGKTNARGLPNPIIFGLMAALGRLPGFRASYPEYSSAN